MENTKQQKEQTASKKQLLEVDRGLNQQPGSKETKHDNHVKSSHHTSSKISATLQKMFHTDKGSDTESEKSENTNIQPGQTSTSNIRFQKTETRKHIHNLSYSKRTHRMQNFFKELGIHGQPAAMNDKHVHSQSLSEKYGKPQEVIGKGAFGIVRIAHKIEPRVPGEKLFAVKEFKRRHNEPAKKYIKRLTSEFCISSSLHHINVIDTLDLLQDTQGNYCEVMEYCSGGDLYSLIVASGGLENDEGNCFFGQLINGVKYLHDNGVAHRDLKPENLILTSNGCLKITDFGNAECFRMAWETQPHLTRGICGSEPYIAPEEFKDELFDSRSVDIWACGIIYMSMMTSSLLWRVAIEKEDMNFKAYLEAKKKDTFTAPFQCLTEGQRELILKIIEPDPKKRITIEQIITDSWFSSIYICHRQTTSTSDSSISSTSCSTNAINEQATAISKTSIANVV